jgi:hypothetical protein
MVRTIESVLSNLSHSTKPIKPLSPSFFERMAVEAQARGDFVNRGRSQQAREWLFERAEEAMALRLSFSARDLTS